MGIVLMTKVPAFDPSSKTLSFRSPNDINDLTFKELIQRQLRTHNQFVAYIICAKFPKPSTSLNISLREMSREWSRDSIISRAASGDLNRVVSVNFHRFNLGDTVRLNADNSDGR